MSSSKRKLGYYGIEFVNTSDRFFDAALFCTILDAIRSMGKEKKLVREERTSKAIVLDEVRIRKVRSVKIARMVFHSCKFNHSPDYMSSVDGSERPTDKQITEGDTELTHLSLRIDDDSANCILEERMNGMSMNRIIKYLNLLLKQCADDNESSIAELIAQYKAFHIEFYAVPSSDFLESINKAGRIITANVFYDKSIIGSGYMNLAGSEATTQDEIIVTVKAKRAKSLAKCMVTNVYNAITAAETKVKRIKLYIKDENGMNAVIDSLNGRRRDEITVELNVNGVVNSESFFIETEPLLLSSENDGGDIFG